MRPTQRYNRFEDYIQVMPSGCWEWQGYRDRFGYGKSGIRLAHRIAYERAHPDTPIEGLSVCHTCDNPPCVNPGHLWLGDPAANAQDRSQKSRTFGQQKTHCKNGHEYTPENTYWRPNAPTQRDCRTCIRQRVDSYKLKRSAAA